MPAAATNDVAILLACLALAAAVMVYIFFIERDPRDEAPHRTRLDHLLERRDMIYDNLRDLKFEHRAGKYSDADFEEMRGALETEAAMVLAEIEMLTGGVVSPVARQARAQQAKESPR